jgi:formamidopyrimidine-DNA glycosylase
MASVLSAAVAARGSSLGDNQYVDLSGRGGSFQESHQVYGRLGAPCARCGRPIQRTVVAQRSHFWCRRCQR